MMGKKIRLSLVSWMILIGLYCLLTGVGFWPLYTSVIGVVFTFSILNSANNMMR